MTIETNGTIATLLDAVAATGAGDALKPRSLHRAFQVTGTFVGTLKLQASNDNTTWIDLKTSVTPEGFSTAEPWAYVRGNCTAYTSGSITLTMAT